MDSNYKHLDEILDMYKVIHVPYYQREYVWGKVNNGRNLYKFIDDIFSQYKENPSADYFIGTLAFCSEKSQNGFDIIDGQQRITSLLLVLSELAKLKCSDAIKERHNKILFPLDDLPEQFVLQEDHSLTEELKCRLNYPNNFNTQGDNANISGTIDRINNLLNNQWGGYNVSWYDGLYNYILKNISFIWLEYSTISDSLKYFLNINSLSIPLTQCDIFFSILSEAMRISECTAKTIYNIQEDINKIAKTFKGLDSQVDVYKAYDRDSQKGVENIIYIFISSYYGDDNNISELNDAGVGKWMSIYKNDVFKNPLHARDFVTKFILFVSDIEVMCWNFDNYNSILDMYKNSSVFTSSVFIRYTKYTLLLKFLCSVFKLRHNYRDGKNNLYISENNHQIDFDKIDEIAKRLNLTILANCVKGEKNLLKGFENNIKVDANGNYDISSDEIIENIEFYDIFNLEYNDGGYDGSAVGKNDSTSIMLVFACQEAFLNSEASKINVEKDMNEYFSNILDAKKFSIEHIYSKKEFDDDRREVWNNVQDNKFETQQDFDTERAKFENLSLLDQSNNSSAGKKTISEKLNIYQNARSINNGENEYLIQSFVSDSEFYKNPFLQALGLPNRAIKSIDRNTWKHSEGNRDFNIKLLKLSLEKMAVK